MSNSSRWSTVFHRYYEQVFPAELVTELAARQPLDCERARRALASREFAFEHCRTTEKLEEGQKRTFFVRHKSFFVPQSLRAYLSQRGSAPPRRVELGAAFNMRSNANKEKGFEAEARELVFDVDLNDYDRVRFCCQGKTVCTKCWILLAAAADILETHLRDNFGFEHILWVFSGRRGLHCWVLDDAAFALTDSVRAYIVDFIQNAPTRLESSATPEAALQRLAPKISAHFENYVRWYAICNDKQRFVVLFGGLCNADQLFDVWKKLPIFPHPAESFMRAVVLYSTGLQARDGSKVLALRLMMHCVYVRIDENVTKRRDHLLKAPFSVHPGTGCICVPLRLEQIAQFNPNTDSINVSETTADLIRCHCDVMRESFPWRL